MACEKTFSVMHHVIQRTISYAHGKKSGIHLKNMDLKHMFHKDRKKIYHCQALLNSLHFKPRGISVD